MFLDKLKHIEQKLWGMSQVLEENQRLKKVEVLQDKEIKEPLKEKRVESPMDQEREI